MLRLWSTAGHVDCFISRFDDIRAVFHWMRHQHVVVLFKLVESTTV
jgi:hypothetical protein